MDKKRSLLNMASAIIFRVAILVLTLLGRRYLITLIGNEINGLNSLYTSLITTISIVELGVGTAIAFCMYKPIIEHDDDKVRAYYQLFKKIYILIGILVTIFGFALMPLIPYLTKDYSTLEGMAINVYLPYGCLVVSTALTYFYSYKISLINAYKNNYISTSIQQGATCVVLTVQLVVLLITKDFYLYTTMNFIGVAIQWVLSFWYCKKHYPQIVTHKIKSKLSEEDQKNVKKNIGAMFMHKLGSLLVNTTDSIIISAFIGVSILGLYTNYTTIITGVTSLINLVFASLISVIGHAFYEVGKSETRKYLLFAHGMNFIIGAVVYLGFYAICDELVVICFQDPTKETFLLPDGVVLVITINYFIQYMRQSVLAFRDATGVFYQDRFKPIFEGLSNLALSLFFVWILRDTEYQVIGVIVATIITNIFIAHTIEPHHLFKYAFGTKTKVYYIRNYLYMALFVGALLGYYYANKIYVNNVYMQLLIDGCISLGFSGVLVLFVILTNKEVRDIGKHLFRRRRNRKNNLSALEEVKPISEEEKEEMEEKEDKAEEIAFEDSEEMD